MIHRLARPWDGGLPRAPGLLVYQYTFSSGFFEQGEQRLSQVPELPL